jgi:hypothetical protein
MENWNSSTGAVDSDSSNKSRIFLADLLGRRCRQGVLVVLLAVDTQVLLYRGFVLKVHLLVMALFVTRLPSSSCHRL